MNDKYRGHYHEKMDGYKEAGLSPDELEHLAEEIRIIVMGDRGLTLNDYIEAAKNIHRSKFGHRKIRALQNEPSLDIYFPDKVYDILKEKGRELKFIRFDESDDAYFRRNVGKGVQWLSSRLYADTDLLYAKAKMLGIKIEGKLHHFTPSEDAFIRNNIRKGYKWLSDELNTTVASVKKRAQRIGVSLKKIEVPFER